ncbi:hypothetical protein L202_03850 [Cryptococcus amylolentus CBS 6039]|uniref:Uncharacterized protein n=2 Tax=Cryptococcus amylolentus TaxID=104669 RepID=A0A1E3HUI0_9TREE|nr:hypothetical protein L202_03850 [Cryptococcus amylolentus CBS 6039]ODN79980.1 hypothetical protein L202_03850 [Cryptococcus amylolentus CBS 6039]ODO08219.1 hypothetical protein I350_03808 [Cryptococcus amylolentus CBS 6273]
MPPVISQALWIAQNAQYIVALFLLFTTLLLSLLGYLILRYFLPTSILLLFSFSAAPGGGKGRGKAGTPKKKVVTKGRSVNTRQTGRGKGVAVEGGVLGGVYRATISALGTGTLPSLLSLSGDKHNTLTNALDRQALSYAPSSH